MPKLTDKERLDIQLGLHKRKPADDGLPKASRLRQQANYGPSSSYTPASDYTTDAADRTDTPQED